MERSSVHIAVLVVAEDPATVDLAAATFLADRVMGAGHRVVAQEIVEASESAVRDQLARWISQGHIDVVISAGAADPAVAALGPLVTSPLQGLTDQLRLLARDRGGEGKPAAARCGAKFVFLLPAEIAALGAVLNQLVLPQLDSTQPRNLVSEMPRHTAVPQTLPAEKTVTGAGLAPKLPAEREKRKTGANVISRPTRVDDPTKPIELESLERKLAQAEGAKSSRSPSHDAVTRPHIDIASMLPPVPPGADDTSETDALPDNRRPSTWDDVATPPPLTVQPSRMRTGPVGVAVAKPVGNDDKTVMRPAPTSRNEDKTVVRPAPTSTRTTPARPASQTNRGVQPTPAIGSPSLRPAAPAVVPPKTATPSIGAPTVKPSVPSVPSVIPSIPKVVGPAKEPAKDAKQPPTDAKQPPTDAKQPATDAKEQTTPGVMSPLARPRPVSGPPSAPTNGAARLPQPTPVSGVAKAADAKALESAPIESKKVPPASKTAEPAKTAETAKTAEPAKATATPIDVVDTAALAAAAAAADAADAEELDPASSADIIEAVPADAAPFDTRTPPPLPPSPPSSASPPPSPSPSARPPTPRAPARPAMPPQMSQTPIDAKTAEAKLAAQARASVPTPPAVTRLANADLPRGSQLAGPELLDLSEGIAKKRRSRTGTALVRRKTSTSIVMYLALAAAAVAGFFAVVHFFPQGGSKRAGNSPPTGSAGSADVVAVAPGSAGSAPSSDVAATGSAQEVVAGSDEAGSNAVDVGAGSAAAVTQPPTSPAPPTPPTPAHPTAHPAPAHPPAHPAPAQPTAHPTAHPGTAPDHVAAAPDHVTAPPAPPAEDGCDEVSCVLEKYQRECCARFKPADSGFHPKNAVPDALDKSMVKAGIEKVKPKVVACGEKSAAKGVVKLAMTVGPEGNITDISVSDSPDPALGECVLAAVKRASFGKSVNGASFTYPFAF